MITLFYIKLRRSAGNIVICYHSTLISVSISALISVSLSALITVSLSALITIYNVNGAFGFSVLRYLRDV